MVKKLLILFTFLFIITIPDVDALTLGAPETFTYFTDGTEVSGTATSADYWGNGNYWKSTSKIGSFTSASPNAFGSHFFWNSANLCQNKDVSISGTIAVLFDFFIEQTYTSRIYMNGEQLACSFTQEDPSRIRYTCFGKGGGNFQIFFDQTSFYGNYRTYDIAVSKDVTLSCDVSNQAIVNQSIQNTQDIINSQNQNTQDIINNNSGNTQNIIDNQNQNTQDVIDNQNSNTEKEIESQRVCKTKRIDRKNIVTTGRYLNNQGNYVTYASYGVTDYISINNNSTLNVLSFSSTGNFCFYTSSKSLISCSPNSSYNSNNNVVNIPDNANYVRFSINNNSNIPTFDLNICENGNQALNDTVNDLNDTLKDDTPPDTENQLNDLNNSLISDTPITDLITLPISLLNSYISGFNGTCLPYNFGNLLGTDIIFPCLNLQQRLGSNLWSIIDSLFSIFMIYNIAMLMIQAFEGFTSLRDDYESLYQPRHAYTGYQPKHGGGN